MPRRPRRCCSSCPTSGTSPPGYAKNPKKPLRTQGQQLKRLQMYLLLERVSGKASTSCPAWQATRLADAASASPHSQAGS